uniref:Uncharacterized protein n=1 Tax=Anguilla anguilla TaxID=7936 RepID=A0A0E9TIV8_ANGAN
MNSLLLKKKSLCHFPHFQ